MAYLVIRHAPLGITRHEEIQLAAKECEVDRGEIFYQIKGKGRYDRADGKFTVILETSED